MPQVVSIFNAVGGGAAALVAAFFAAMNVVGGYSLTDRMLQMFRKRAGPGARDGGSGHLDEKS